MPLSDNMFGDAAADALDGADDGSQGQGQGGSAAEQETVRRLTQVTEDQVKARVMAELMKDPEVFALMRARQAGKQVRIVEGDATNDGANQGNQQQGVDDFDDAALEGMSRKEMMGAVLKSVTKQLDNFFKTRSQPLEQRLGQLENTANTVVQERTQQAVTTTAAKYPDFWTFKDQMIQLSQRHPSLDAEELYMMAKAKSGKLVPKTSRVSLERPTNTSPRPPKVKQDNHTEQAIRELATQSLRGFFDANADRIDLSDDALQGY